MKNMIKENGFFRPQTSDVLEASFAHFFFIAVHLLEFGADIFLALSFSIAHQLIIVDANYTDIHSIRQRFQ